MSTPPTVCFVVADGEGAASAQAAALARRGWAVHFLACSEEVGTAIEGGEAGAVGVVVHRLEKLPAVPGDSVQRFGGDDPAVVLGERVQAALEALLSDYRFDLIEFFDGGVAMRSVQSKRSAAAFLDVPLAVRLVTSAARRRVEEEATLSAPRELKLDFCEAYAFEHADLRPAESGEGRADTEVERFYSDLLERRHAAAPAAAKLTLTVVVAHHNHERYLEATLASLAAQTRPADEVIVIDDGSTSAAALEVFAAQESRYPQWRFIRQKNAGPGATRNHGLELAAGDCFLPFDSDNLAVETMVERLLAAMEANPDRVATACHNLGFTDSENIAAGRFVSRYSPTGGPLVLAAVENVFGDTSSIFRTEALRSVGGFETNLWSPTEDWETFAKMATRGLEVDVLPLPLFYYRTESGGRLQRLGTDRATKLRLRAHLVDEFFAAAALGERERRELFEALQAFDDFIGVGLEARLTEQRRWHDTQMADLDHFREEQVERVRGEWSAKAEEAEGRAAAERARAEAAERELNALREATSGPLLSWAVRWRGR
jgi:glycosyltransferase involved in cell wall biosynthesis